MNNKLKNAILISISLLGFVYAGYSLYKRSKPDSAVGSTNEVAAKKSIVLVKDSGNATQANEAANGIQDFSAPVECIEEIKTICKSSSPLFRHYYFCLSQNFDKLSFLCQEKVKLRATKIPPNLGLEKFSFPENCAESYSKYCPNISRKRTRDLYFCHIAFYDKFPEACKEQIKNYEGGQLEESFAQKAEQLFPCISKNSCIEAKNKYCSSHNSAITPGRVAVCLIINWEFLSSDCQTCFLNKWVE